MGHLLCAKPWHCFYEGVTGSSEKAMGTHSSTLAWKIPWTEEPGRLQSMGLQRVGHDWSNLAAAAAPILMANIWGRGYFYSCFKEDETEAQRCSHMATITKLECGRAGVWTCDDKLWGQPHLFYFIFGHTTQHVGSYSSQTRGWTCALYIRTVQS